MIEASVVIPVFNKWDFTRKCLKSLAANTPKDKIEVIVVDNASSDSTPKGCEFLGKQLFGENFHYIRNEENRNFAGASNQGAELAQGEFLVFLNNDTEVQPGWYEPLIGDFTVYPDIAATGPLLVYPEETPLGKLVQHLGILITPFLKFAHLYEKIPANSPLVRKRRFFQAITGACLVIRKKLFIETGKFDERFINGFEDVDFCLRLSSKGYRFTINTDSVVVHHESTTPGRHAYEEKNSQLLFTKMPVQSTPDWHIHLKNDGLTLQVSKWLRYKIIDPVDKDVAFDNLVPSMSVSELRDTLVSHPYCRKGWLEIIRKTNCEEERTFFFKTYLKLFCDLESLFALADLSNSMGNLEIKRKCANSIKNFATNPTGYVSDWRQALKWFVSCVMPVLAEQVAEYIRNRDTFLREDYPRFAKKLWKLERDIGIFHSPDDRSAYNLWWHGIDAPAREKELAGFYNEFRKSSDDGPKISILMPVYNPEPKYLREALDSVLAQTYPHWELCIADDASTNPETGTILAEYAARDSRIRFVRRKKNGHIAAATNTALELVTHPWAAFMDQDDLLTQDALAFVAKAIVENPDAVLLYSDEDKIDASGLMQPHFKNSNWDRDLIPVQNFVCHLAVYNTDRLRALGGLREGFPGAQDHELVLRYTGNTASSQFVHIPHVLYHWRAHAGSTAFDIKAKSYVNESADAATQAWLDEHEPGAVIEPLPLCAWTRIKAPMPSPRPSVSIVCLVPASVFPIETYNDLMTSSGISETIFVCKQSYFHELSSVVSVKKKDNLTIVPIPDDCNSAKRLQIGAEMVSGDVIGFLDGNTVPQVGRPWLDEIISCLYRPGVGAVGGKINAPDGTLLHGGYLADASGGLKPLFVGHRWGCNSQIGWTRLARTVDALDRLCMFTRTSDFRNSGGFNASMADWAVQDYCLRLAQQDRKLRSVWWPFAEFKLFNPVFTGYGVEYFIKKWKLKPANRNILAVGDGWELNDLFGKRLDFSPQ